MNILEIINKKKNNNELSYDEIKYAMHGFVFEKNIQDYQISSLLMAMRLTKTRKQEAYNLTKVLVDSSIKYNFEYDGIIIDKHSSGGVGDKLSLILTPILAALGYGVCKLSGRGLGHTGGTIDKLESVGVQTMFDNKQISKIFKKTNSFILQQSEQAVPIDKKLYALRDVTGTVDCYSLMASSILSKKLIVNSDYIFLDIKVGSGALIKKLSEAKKFSKILLDIATGFNRKLVIHITDMNDVLGSSVGNAIEIQEAIDFLLNVEQEKKLRELVYNFLIDILIITNKCKTKIEAFKIIEDVINSKKAYECFIKMIKEQKGNFESVKNNDFFNPKYKKIIKAKQNGYIKYLSCQSVGETAVMLGAGRYKKTDKIDFQAGIKLLKKTGEFVNKNDDIAVLYSNNKIPDNILTNFYDNIKYLGKKPKHQKSILKQYTN